VRGLDRAKDVGLHQIAADQLPFGLQVREAVLPDELDVAERLEPVLEMPDRAVALRQRQQELGELLEVLVRASLDAFRRFAVALFLVGLPSAPRCRSSGFRRGRSARRRSSGLGRRRFSLLGRSSGGFDARARRAGAALRGRARLREVGFDVGVIEVDPVAMTRRGELLAAGLGDGRLRNAREPREFDARNEAHSLLSRAARGAAVNRLTESRRLTLLQKPLCLRGPRSPMITAHHVGPATGPVHSHCNTCPTQEYSVSLLNEVAHLRFGEQRHGPRPL
jgi:hypothetical protein